MKIKRIYINKYGPLNEIELKLNPGIQPIYGCNESGKTLIVDFLIKKLAGKDVYKIESLKRVEEIPEGFIVIDKNEQEIKLEKDDLLSKILDVSPEEICNIFLIRDSDLKIDKEYRFFESITDKLTGLSSNDIEDIIKKILFFGRLTPGKKEIANSKDSNWASENLAKAEKLKKDILGYLDEAKEYDLFNIEAQVFEDYKRSKKLKKEIALLEMAEKKEEYENIEKIVSESEKILKQIENLPEIVQITLLKDRLTRSISSELESSKFYRVNTFSKVIFLTTIPISAVLWLIWVFLNNAFLGIFSPILHTIFCIIGLFLWLYSVNKISIINKEKNEILNKSRKIGISLTDFEELEELLDNKYLKIKEINDRLKENIGVLKDKYKIKTDSHIEITKEVKEILLKTRNTINFRVKTKFDEKTLIEKRADKEELEGKINSLKDQLENHRTEITNFNRRANEIDFNSFIGKNLEIDIQNFESLRKLKLKLEELIRIIRNDAENGKIASNIFSEILAEEKEKVSRLFSNDCKTVEIFREFTDGKYINVKYDSNDSTIIVVKANGEELTVDKLSKGTFDQLYLAIRFDLAQRILGDQSGFFVMDDTFLTASRDRFENGKKIFSKLVKKGWQIIYFSAKDIDCKELSEISANKIIELKPLR